jgi:hypothetical protein
MLAFGESGLIKEGLIRRLAFGESGLIKGLIRRLAFGECGLIKEGLIRRLVLWWEWPYKRRPD